MFIDFRKIKIIFILENRKYKILNKEKRVAQRGARTHDPEIKSLMLYRLS
jgi:hypothetical protein